MADGPEEREWMTRAEIMQLVTGTELRVLVAEWVRELITSELNPFHAENKRRFAEIEHSLNRQNVEIAIVREQGNSQNRHIADISARQAERYEEQRTYEKRESESRHMVAQQLQIIQDKMFLNATDEAHQDGRDEIVDEHWEAGKSAVATAVKTIAGLIGLGALGRWIWSFLNRWHH